MTSPSSPTPSIEHGPLISTVAAEFDEVLEALARDIDFRPEWPDTALGAVQAVEDTLRVAYNAAHSHTHAGGANLPQVRAALRLTCARALRALHNADYYRVLSTPCQEC